MAGKIYISYRRDDDPSAAARLCDGLAQRFGKASLFMDVDNLLAGQRFDEELARALSECDVLIAVMGARWVELLEAKGGEGERDYVREEIAEALRRRIIVVPVRVGRDGQLPPLPRAEALPPDIRELVVYQKHDVTHEHWGRDIAELIEAIVAVRRAKRPPLAAPRLPWGWIGASAAATVLVAYAAAHFAGAPMPWPQSAPKERAAPKAEIAAERARRMEEQSRASELVAQAKQEQEARAKAEAEAKRNAELAAHAKREQEAQEARQKEETERLRIAALKAEEDRHRTEAEAKRKADEEAEAKRKADEEAEAKRMADEKAEAQRKADEAAEAKHKADREAEAKPKAEVDGQANKIERKAPPPTGDPRGLLGTWHCSATNTVTRTEDQYRQVQKLQTLLQIERFDGKYYWAQGKITRSSDGAIEQFKSKLWFDGKQLYRQAYWGSPKPTGPFAVTWPVPVALKGNSWTTTISFTRKIDEKVWRLRSIAKCTR